MVTKSNHSGIVVGVDGSAASAEAVRWAAEDAVLRGLKITLLQTISSPFGRPPSDEMRRKADQIIDGVAAMVADVVGGNALVVSRELLTGHPVDVLVEQSKHADLVVVGFRGHGLFGQRLLGPVSEGVLYHAHCPVAVVRADARETLRAADAPVLVGVDGSATSERAIAWAFEEAQARGVPVVAVYAHRDAPDDRADASLTLQNVLSPHQERYPGVDVVDIVTAERPAVELVNRSQTAQLVVVGSRGRGGFAGMLLGSVSSDVVRSVEVPIIVARTT